MNASSRRIATWLAVTALQAAIAVRAAESNPVAHAPQARVDAASLDVLIKLRPDTSAGATQKLGNPASRSQALARRTGLAVQLTREVSDRLVATHIDLVDRDPAVRMHPSDLFLRHCRPFGRRAGVRPVELAIETMLGALPLRGRRPGAQDRQVAI